MSTSLTFPPTPFSQDMMELADSLQLTPCCLGQPLQLELGLEHHIKYQKPVGPVQQAVGQDAQLHLHLMVNHWYLFNRRFGRHLFFTHILGANVSCMGHWIFVSQIYLLVVL